MRPSGGLQNLQFGCFSQVGKPLTARDEDLDPKERAFVAHLAVAAPDLAEAAGLAKRLDTMLRMARPKSWTFGSPQRATLNWLPSPRGWNAITPPCGRPWLSRGARARWKDRSTS